MAEEMILIDDNKKEYIFKLELEANSIHFWLKENKVYAPFTFENSYTLEDLIKLHKAFKACDDIEEVYKHFLNLYKKGRLILMDIISREKLLINCIIYYISESDKENFDLFLEKKMTEEKDEALLELYKKQKEQLAKLKKIKKYIGDGLAMEHPMFKEINELIKKCYSKVDY